MIGHVVLGGRRFPVVNIALAEGAVRLVFNIWGPAEPFSGNITIFGEDGQGLWQGRAYTLPAIPAGVCWACTYDLRIAEIYRQPDVVFGEDGKPV